MTVSNFAPAHAVRLAGHDFPDQTATLPGAEPVRAGADMMAPIPWHLEKLARPPTLVAAVESAMHPSRGEVLSGKLVAPAFDVCCCDAAGLALQSRSEP